MAERARLKQVRSFLNAQARLIKGRQAQLHADQQAWKRNMRALTSSPPAGGGEEHERMHAIMRKLRHTIERQASTLNDDTEHLQSCFLWLRQLDAAARAHAATSGAKGASAGGGRAGGHFKHENVFSDDGGDEADTPGLGAALEAGGMGREDFAFSCPPSHLTSNLNAANLSPGRRHEKTYGQHAGLGYRDLPQRHAGRSAALSPRRLEARRMGAGSAWRSDSIDEVSGLMEAHSRHLRELSQELKPPPRRAW